MNRGYGGFPTPIELIKRFIIRFLPNLHRRLNRTMSMPRSNTVASAYGGTIGGLSGDGAKEAPYITFDALVGRNSQFHELTSEQRDELGGVEYRALKTLFWIVLAVSATVDMCEEVRVAAENFRLCSIISASNSLASLSWARMFRRAAVMIPSSKNSTVSCPSTGSRLSRVFPRSLTRGCLLWTNPWCHSKRLT